MEFTELNQLIEKVVKKKVIRAGQRVKIKTSDKEGYKIQDGKEVKISSREKINRARSMKKAVIKRKSTKNASLLKRAKSMKKVI